MAERTKFFVEYLRNGITKTEIITAESHEKAVEKITEKYKNVSYCSAKLLKDAEMNENKMYFFKVPKRTNSGLADFLNFSETYLDSFPEVPNTAETVGRFTLDYMGKDLDYIPALVVMNSNDSIVEYYVFDDPETLKHEIINDSNEDELLLNISNLKNAMTNAREKSLSTNEETTEKFCKSEFVFKFIDGVENKTHSVNLTMCAQYYNFFYKMLSDLSECIKNEF